MLRDRWISQKRKVIKAHLSAGGRKVGRLPCIHVVGVMGHCGEGAVNTCLAAGILTQPYVSLFYHNNVRKTHCVGPGIMQPRLSIVAIDHLPSLLPRQASDACSHIRFCLVSGSWPTGSTQSYGRKPRTLSKRRLQCWKVHAEREAFVAASRYCCSLCDFVVHSKTKPHLLSVLQFSRTPSISG